MPAHPFGMESSQLENSDVTITIKPQVSMFESDSEESEAKRKGTKQGKMEKSFLTFKATYPDWEPNTPQGKKMIDNLSVFLMEQADRMQAGPMGTSMYATRNMVSEQSASLFLRTGLLMAKKIFFCELNRVRAVACQKVETNMLSQSSICNFLS
jgi:hypothetical protein